VTIEMIFPREPGDNRNNFLEELHFGPSPMGPEYIYRDPNKVIKPGETGDLEIGPQVYSSIKDALRKLSYPNSIRRVELRMREVGFEDGSVLLSGTLWIQDRNSPNDPTKKIRANKAKAPGARHHATRIPSSISRTPYSHSKLSALLNAAQSGCFEQDWTDLYYCGLEGTGSFGSSVCVRSQAIIWMLRTTETTRMVRRLIPTVEDSMRTHNRTLTVRLYRRRSDTARALSPAASNTRLA
jgi:hypothetical protein